MIEEAAGTSMYESKKTLALRTLEKKQLKVDEIDRIIKDEIEPQLTKLKEEKRAFLEWSDLVKQADEIERFVISWDYRSVAGKLQGGGGQYDATEKELKGWTDAQKTLRASVTKGEERAKNDVKALEKQRAGQEEAEKNLEDEIQASQRKLTEHKAVVKEKSSTLKSNSGRQLKSKSQESKLEKQIAETQAEVEAASAEFEALKKSLVDIDAQIEAKQQLVSDLNAGGTGAGASGQSLQQEVVTLKSKLEEIVTEIKTVGIRLKGFETQLKQLQQSSKSGAKSGGSEYDRMVAERAGLVDRRTELEKKLGSNIFNPVRFQELGDLIKSNERKIEGLTEQRNSLTGSVAQRLSFEVPGLEDQQRRIKGMVAKLLCVKPEYGEKYLKALEILAGGKLFNVVVDSEKTSREILESGRLKRRITLLPLDKIQGKKVAETQIREAGGIAKKIGGEAIPAIETVAFVDELAAAIEYVFGTSFVCDSDEVGKRVTFNSNLPDHLKHRTVTVDGDVYDPKGSLTGGSDDGGRGNPRMLGIVYELQKVQYELAEFQNETAKLQGERQRMVSYKEAYEKCNRELNSVGHLLNVLESKLKSTSQSQLADEIAALEEGIKTGSARLAELETAKKSVNGEIGEIEKQIADITKNKGEKIKAATGQVTALKKEKKSAQDTLKTAETKQAQLVVDLKSAEEELRSFRDDLTTQSAQSSVLESEISALEEKIQTVKDHIETLQAKLKETKVFKASFDKSIQDIAEGLRAEKEKLDEADVNVKKFESLMEQLGRERKEAKVEIDRLERDHSWLRQARDRILGDEQLGAKSKTEVEKLKNKLVDIKDDVTIRGKSINRRIVPLIEKSERDAEDLLGKREALEKEKKSIQEFIHELDDKKGRALSKTWQIVNANFGAIFRSLLPHVDAKLAPPEGLSALEGLELKVQLGSVWKDSLTELSGGQKSLLALSLVLALLLFKPAPFYILDEVDAALDVSHTRNIGKMIKQHFPHSQFVVVSLKEGMFNNANVLYKVTFENGTSVVKRTEQESAGGAFDGPAIDYKPVEFVPEETTTRAPRVSKGGKAKAKSQPKAKAAKPKKTGKSKSATASSSSDEAVDGDDSDVSYEQENKSARASKRVKN